MPNTALKVAELGDFTLPDESEEFAGRDFVVTRQVTFEPDGTVPQAVLQLRLPASWGSVVTAAFGLAHRQDFAGRTGRFSAAQIGHRSSERSTDVFGYHFPNALVATNAPGLMVYEVLPHPKVIQELQPHQAYLIGPHNPLGFNGPPALGKFQRVLVLG